MGKKTATLDRLDAMANTMMLSVLRERKKYEDDLTQAAQICEAQVQLVKELAQLIGEHGCSEQKRMANVMFCKHKNKMKLLGVVK